MLREKGDHASHENKRKHDPYHQGDCEDQHTAEMNVSLFV